VFEQWTENTAWGQLFLRYAQMGPQGLAPIAGASASPSARVH